MPSRSMLLPQLIKYYCLQVWTLIAKSGSACAPMSIQMTAFQKHAVPSVDQILLFTSMDTYSKEWLYLRTYVHPNDCLPEACCSLSWSNIIVYKYGHLQQRVDLLVHLCPSKWMLSRSVLLPQLIKYYCLQVWTLIAKSGSVCAPMSNPKKTLKLLNTPLC